MEHRGIHDILGTDPSAGETPALVVLVNNLADWRRVQEEHWYRIPLRRAPRLAGAAYLAFYHSGAFEEERWSIRWYAPVRSVQVLPRHMLIPDEPAHPRAQELYLRYDLGPLEALPAPVPSRRLRRVTFIPTTLERLLSAGDVSQLWIKQSLRERLWVELNRQGFHAEMDAGIEGLPDAAFDFVVPCEHGGVAVDLEQGETAGRGYREALPAYAPADIASELQRLGWSRLCFERGSVPTIMQRIREAVDAHGGMRLRPALTAGR